jgi:hypothetical protein
MNPPHGLTFLDSDSFLTDPISPPVVLDKTLSVSALSSLGASCDV